MSPLLQSLVVLAIVLACSVSVLRRLAPRMAWQAQARLSFFLERDGRPGWLKRLGQSLRPPMQASAAACGTGGCNTCRGCD
ncbi:DUF6587 family protein [Arenimonas sp.]|uniref:DUF6587 family protein n=1 Tax=Arenimonas sp. TaxID=1872635 RepID=UPI0035B0DE8C